MPTEWERGFMAGWKAALNPTAAFPMPPDVEMAYEQSVAKRKRTPRLRASLKSKKKRKLSSWQKFVKANSKKKKYIYQSGAKKGKLNLKKMGVDYRKKKR